MDKDTIITAATHIVLIGMIIYVAIIGIKIGLNKNKQK